MNLVQQLAEYQNAPIQSLEMAKKGANPAISPWVAAAILSDRIEKQKRMGMEQGAAMGPQPTVADQQDQELSGIMQAMPQQGAPQAQPAPQGAPVMAAEGGLMSADVDPGMYDYCGGGIIAFEEGGKAESESAEEKQRKEDQAALAKLWESIKGANRSAGAAIADIATLPVRGLAGAYDTAVVRPMRAAGVDAGYLSKHLVPEGVDPSSMTPFYDKYIRAAEQKEAPAPAPAARPVSNLSSGESAKQAEYARLVKQGMPPEMAAKAAGMTSAAAPAAAPPKAPPGAPGKAPAGGAPAGAAKDSGIMAQLTSSSEWADLDAARKKQFEAPKLPATAGEQAAERAAHLKAQGITEMPWDTAANQTAELRRIMGEEDADRKKRLTDTEQDERYRTFVANLGSGSFGQSAQGGLRANLKREADLRAEDQRIKELRYNQNLKLNEIDAKAKELRYNEATGDVAAAQKNRKEIAELKNEFEKNKIAIAKGQAGIREQGLAAQLSADTQLKAARERAAAGVGSETKETQMAEAAFARDPEAASIKKQLEGHMSEAMRIAKVRRLREIQAAKYKQFGLTLDGTMSAPSAAGAGGTASGKWGPAQVVK